VNCRYRFAVKHLIRIPPLRPGRRLSWTFEVSAAADKDNDARRKNMLKKQQPASHAAHSTRRPAARLETAVPEAAGEPLVTPRAAQHPAAKNWRVTHPRTMVAAGMAVLAVLMVAAVAFSGRPSEPAQDEVAAVSQPSPQERPAEVVAPKRRTAAVRTASIAGSTRAVPRTVSAPSPKTPEAVAGIAVKEDAATKLPGSEAIRPAAVASVSTDAGATPVTITGCLEVSVDQDEFRLTDTDGLDAPRSRSWRSGFLKKQSTPVALVEPPARLALQTHVGRRVTATGLLTSHDLRVTALRFVGPPCN
jgi:hypothetical protein